MQDQNIKYINLLCYDSWKIQVSQLHFCLPKASLNQFPTTLFFRCICCVLEKRSTPDRVVLQSVQVSMCLCSAYSQFNGGQRQNQNKKYLLCQMAFPLFSILTTRHSHPTYRKKGLAKLATARKVQFSCLPMDFTHGWTVVVCDHAGV